MSDTDELKLDDQEAMEFHYFKVHDYDNNNKLDGLELAAAMTHYHGEEGGQEKAQVRGHCMWLATCVNHTISGRLPNHNPCLSLFHMLHFPLEDMC